MRLLNTTTGQFYTVDDPRSVKYAILSHVWSKQDDPHYDGPELSYHQVRELQEKAKGRSPQPESIIPDFPSKKVRRFCEVAAQNDYDYGWADACCIDQTSSSELSEAINSMYDWYRYADVCYVFLHDVPTSTAAELSEALGSPFEDSMWHKRGWTLQELLAPRRVVFFSAQWDILGTKHSLVDLLCDITGIDCDALTLRKPLELFSVACRMSWAWKRQTTREEDEAYSLLGIFGVHLPTNYGERRYAFIRLQEEILKHIPDQTIFAWGPFLPSSQRNFSLGPTSATPANWTWPTVHTSSPSRFLLASSPRDFCYSTDLVSIPWVDFMQRLGRFSMEDRPTYTMTPYGINTRLPLVVAGSEDPQTNAPACIALLACKNAANDEPMALLLCPQPEQTDADYYVGAIVGRLSDMFGPLSSNNTRVSSAPAPSSRYFRMSSLSSFDMQVASDCLQWSEVYIPYWPSQASYNLLRDGHLHTALRSVPPHESFDLQVCTLTRRLLKSLGYLITNRRGRDVFMIDLVTQGSHAPQEGSNVYVTVRRCNCQYGEKYGYLSVDVLLKPSSENAPSRRPVPHVEEHHSHVHSWMFSDGAASKEFYLRFPDARRITVQLTLTRSKTTRHLYILAVDMWTPLASDLERERSRRRSKFDEVPRSPTNTTPASPGPPARLPLTPISRGPSLKNGTFQRPWGMPAVEIGRSPGNQPDRSLQRTSSPGYRRAPGLLAPEIVHTPARPPIHAAPEPERISINTSLGGGTDLQIRTDAPTNVPPAPPPPKQIRTDGGHSPLYHHAPPPPPPPNIPSRSQPAHGPLFIVRNPSQPGGVAPTPITSEPGSEQLRDAKGSTPQKAKAFDNARAAVGVRASPRLKAKRSAPADSSPSETLGVAGPSGGAGASNTPSRLAVSSQVVPGAPRSRRGTGRRGAQRGGDRGRRRAAASGTRPDAEGPEAQADEGLGERPSKRMKL